MKTSLAIACLLNSAVAVRFFSQNEMSDDEVKESLASILQDDLGLKNSEVELVDRAILYYGIYEIDNKELPKEVVIDECIRLSRKFSSPDSYKFINVYLDKFIKMKRDK